MYLLRTADQKLWIPPLSKQSHLLIGKTSIFNIGKHILFILVWITYKITDC